MQVFWSAVICGLSAEHFYVVCTVHNCLYKQARWLHDSEWVPSAGIPSFPQTSPFACICPRSPDSGSSHQSNCGNNFNGEIYITTIAGAVRCIFIYMYIWMYERMYVTWTLWCLLSNYLPSLGLQYHVVIW
jgi:hypothetical protein